MNKTQGRSRRNLLKTREDLDKLGASLEDVLKDPSLTQQEKKELSRYWVTNHLGPLKRK